MKRSEVSEKSVETHKKKTPRTAAHSRHYIKQASYVGMIRIRYKGQGKQPTLSLLFADTPAFISEYYYTPVLTACQEEIEKPGR